MASMTDKMEKKPENIDTTLFWSLEEHQQFQCLIKVLSSLNLIERHGKATQRSKYLKIRKPNDQAEQYKIFANVINCLTRGEEVLAVVPR